MAKKPSSTYTCWAILTDDHRTWVVRAVVLLVEGWVQAVVGDDVNAVSGKDMAVGVLVAGTGVDAHISQLQALNQQTSLHLEETVVALRELRGGERVTKRRRKDYVQVVKFKFTHFSFTCTFNIMRQNSLLQLKCLSKD